jgi:hypothetical protein
MLELTNLKAKNFELSKDQTKIITGSGALSVAGGITGAVVGGVGGTVSYPVKEGWSELASGKSNFNLNDYGESIVGGATTGAVTGSGLGKWLESTS